MALLVVVVAASSAALVAGLDTQSRAGAQWDAAFAKANGAHVEVTSTHADVLSAVARDPRVSTASAQYRLLENGLQIRSRGGNESIQLREMGPDAVSTVARPLLREGRWVHAGARDELVIDRSYAIDRKIHVGDRVVIRQAGRDIPFTVVGRALDFVDCFYPQCDPSPAWLDPAAFGRFDLHDSYRAEFLRLHHPKAVNAFVASVEDRYGDRAGTQDYLDTRNDALIISGFFGAFLSGFGVFVMVAAALVVLGSMASRVVARRRDIGLLKAVGVTPRQVAFAIVVAHAIAAAVGVAAGWVLGGLLSTRLRLNVAKVLGASGASFPLSRLLIALVVMELIVVGAILVPALRTGRLDTTRALSPVVPVTAHRSRLARTGERFGIGPVGTAGLRDAVARPARALFTVLALAVAVVAVVVSLGFNRTIDRGFNDPAATGDPYDLIAVPRDTAADRATIVRTLDADRDVTTWFTATERKGVIDGGSYLVRALGGDVQHSGYHVQSGRLPRRADEAVVGYGLLHELGVSVGDRVSVHLGRATVPLRIVGWYSEIEDSGQVLMFPLATLQRVQPGAVAEGYFAHLRTGVTQSSASASLQRTLRGHAQVVINQPDSHEEINAFRTTVVLVTALVVVVAFVNLASTLLLAVRERTHDLGVLRSVGFTPRQVLGASAIGAGVLAFVAVLVGVPVGWGLYRALMRAVGEGVGIGPSFARDPATLAVVLLFPGAIVVAIALGALVARRAATAEVSDLVRYE
jgi:putative ABC transport system permease protein